MLGRGNPEWGLRSTSLYVELWGQGERLYIDRFCDFCHCLILSWLQAAYGMFASAGRPREGWLLTSIKKCAGEEREALSGSDMLHLKAVELLVSKCFQGCDFTFTKGSWSLQVLLLLLVSLLFTQFFLKRTPPLLSPLFHFCACITTPTQPVHIYEAAVEAHVKRLISMNVVKGWVKPPWAAAGSWAKLGAKDQAAVSVWISPFTCLCPPSLFQPAFSSTALVHDSHPHGSTHPVWNH